MEGQCALINGCVCQDRTLTLQSQRSRILILLDGSIRGTCQRAGDVWVTDNPREMTGYCSQRLRCGCAQTVRSGSIVHVSLTYTHQSHHDAISLIIAMDAQNP